MLLWGDKTQSFFDIWSVEHFIAGMGMILPIYYLCNYFMPEIHRSDAVSKRKSTFHLLVCLAAVAMFWESFEFYMEAGYSGVDKITHWFQGVEFWGNRLVADPALTVLGGYFGLRYKKTAIAARVLSLVWLGLNLFVFPDSMYLQRLIEAH